MRIAIYNLKNALGLYHHNGFVIVTGIIGNFDTRSMLYLHNKAKCSSDIIESYYVDDLKLEDIKNIVFKSEREAISKIKSFWNVKLLSNTFYCTIFYIQSYKGNYPC